MSNVHSLCGEVSARVPCSPSLKPLYITAFMESMKLFEVIDFYYAIQGIQSLIFYLQDIDLNLHYDVVD